MRQKKGIIALFLLPAVIICILMFVYPTVRTVVMSFYNIKNIISDMAEWKFVGLSNYIDLYHNSLFMKSVWNVIKIWIYGGIGVFFFAFMYAVILSSGVRGQSFWRSVLYLPNVISAVAMVMMWVQYVYNPDYGLFKSFFQAIGLKSVAAVNLNEPQHAFGALLFAFGFGLVGYFMLMFKAGMDRIPGDFYEAAIIEGAGIRIKFFKITLPLLRDVFRIALVLWTTIAFNFFVWTQLYSTPDSPPEVYTPAYFLYKKAFQNQLTASVEPNAGMAAAVGIIITIMVLLGMWIVNRFFSEERLEY